MKSRKSPNLAYFPIFSCHSWHVHAGFIAILSLAGCEWACGPSLRQEAQQLLAIQDAVDLEAAPEKRRQQLSSLRAWNSKHEELRQAQQACLKAHDALLTAEEEQQSARKALEALTQGADSQHFSAEQAGRLSSKIARSKENVLLARELFPACEHAVRTLTLRYGKR